MLDIGSGRASLQILSGSCPMQFQSNFEALFARGVASLNDAPRAYRPRNSVNYVHPTGNRISLNCKLKVRPSSTRRQAGFPVRLTAKTH
jgi:hypothetical protein